MLPLAQVTLAAHSGGVGVPVASIQSGVPERLMDVTVQPRETADLQIREPVGVSGAGMGNGE